MMQRDREIKQAANAPDQETFWAWCLQAYAKPGVAEACLMAQDRLGADVNLLLLALWSDATGVGIAEDDWPRLLEISVQWQRDRLGPMRARRRAAKGTTGYDALKAEELVLEKQEQAALLAYLKSALQPGGGSALNRYLAHIGALAADCTAFTDFLKEQEHAHAHP